MPILLVLAGLVLGGTAAVIAWVVPSLRNEATAPVAHESPPPVPAALPAPALPDAGAEKVAQAAPSPPRPLHRRPAPPTPAAARAASDSGPGHLTVTAATWGAVYVDGKQVAPQTPLYRYALPAGRHTVKLFQPSTGRYSRERPVEVEAGQLATVTFP
jgi:hypothetical protein